MTNRMGVFIDGCGLVPVRDDPIEFLAGKPCRIGDDALIRVCGGVRMVRLLSSHSMVRNALYLVDMEPRKKLRD